jgi:hypothetical protein
MEIKQMNEEYGHEIVDFREIIFFVFADTFLLSSIHIRDSYDMNKLNYRRSLSSIYTVSVLSPSSFGTCPAKSHSISLSLFRKPIRNPTGF